MKITFRSQDVTSFCFWPQFSEASRQSRRHVDRKWTQKWKNDWEISARKRILVNLSYQLRNQSLSNPNLHIILSENETFTCEQNLQGFRCDPSKNPKGVFLLCSSLSTRPLVLNIKKSRLELSRCLLVVSNPTPLSSLHLRACMIHLSFIFSLSRWKTLIKQRPLLSHRR